MAERTLAVEHRCGEVAEHSAIFGRNSAGQGATLLFVSGSGVGSVQTQTKASWDAAVDWFPS